MSNVSPPPCNNIFSFLRFNSFFFCLSRKVIHIQNVLVQDYDDVSIFLFPLEKEQKEIMVSKVCIKERHIFCNMSLVCSVFPFLR